MTTGLLIIVHFNYLGLRHMNHGLTLSLSFPLFRLVSGTLGSKFGHVHLRHIRFSQKLVEVLGWEETLPWARGVINCTPPSALSFWVSLFPWTGGYNSRCLIAEGFLFVCLICFFFLSPPIGAILSKIQRGWEEYVKGHVCGVTTEVLCRKKILETT